MSTPIADHANLKDAEAHFAFGKNWASYAVGIGETQIAEAIAALRRLSGMQDFSGKRFLDIGCGSGVHSLAALRLGAAEVVAVDIDTDSVATTSATLKKFAPGAKYRVTQCSVFDLKPEMFGHFDVVYSWGVLHHTGGMVEALENAARLVAPGGVFLVALYRKTYLCGFWKVEKKWYAGASERSQRVAQRLFLWWYRLLAACLGLARRVRGLLQGRSSGAEGFAARVSNYRYRGMDFYHDVHDWLGGHPYESILPDEVDALMARAGLRIQETFLCRPNRRTAHGLLGSGCDEYRYVRG